MNHETDSDGEQFRYEKTKTKEVTEKVRHDMNYKKDFTPETIRQFSEMIEHSCANNKAWLKTALGDACKPKKISNTGTSSSKGGDDKRDKEEVMERLQYAWDASTQLTADAGLLAQKVLRNPTEAKSNHERVARILQIMKDMADPSAKILDMLVLTVETLDSDIASRLLNNGAKMFLELEKEHQLLIEKSLSSKQYKKELSNRMRSLKNN